jgi:chaperonin GroES
VRKAATKKKAAARAKAASQGRPGGKSRPAVPSSTLSTTGGRKMPNVKPLRDRVLVRRIEKAEEKVGGIIIPDSAKEKPTEAEVVAVGSGRVLEDGKRVPLDLKAGDKVLVGKWSGTDVKIDGEEYLILKEEEILGVLG